MGNSWGKEVEWSDGSPEWRNIGLPIKEKEHLEINFEADGSWWASLVVVVGVTVGVPGSRTSFKSSSINWK